MKPTVAVDLDGVLARYYGWRGVDHIGEPLPGAVDFTKRLSEWAHVLVFTCRVNARLQSVPDQGIDDLYYKVMNWLKKHEFKYNEIYVGQGKPLAVAYIDDRAVPCTPQRQLLTSMVYREAEDLARDLAEREKAESHNNG